MKKVTVLMSTYNGEKYLKEQLDSILNQQGVDVSLLIRDDGSTDKTRDILEEYSKNKKITWYFGDNLKPALSFMDLINKTKETDYYALCDQDDVWLDNKLIKAINKLEQYPNTQPNLYYGLPIIVDKKLNTIHGIDDKRNKMMTFESSMISSNAIGCTMVFNYELLKLVRSKNPDYIIMHDAWIHKVCLLFNGNIIWDPNVAMLYRQHDNNVIGAHKSKIRLFKTIFFDKSCKRSNTIKSLYKCYKHEIDEDKKTILELVVNYKKSFFKKNQLLFCKKIKTDSILKNMMFKISVLFGTY